jgi:hypothetical protein
MEFNASAYVLTAQETLDKKKALDAFIKENQHLALPFPVDGLEKLIPPIMPGQVGLIGGGSYHGKSLFAKYWMWKAQLDLEETKRRAVIAYVSHEDTGEMTAKQQLKKYNGNEMKYADDLFIYIGRSFGMKPEDVAELYMTNIIHALEYARKTKFAEPMPFSSIFYDFIQKTPPDPERRKMTNSEQRRMQLADDSTRLGNGAVYFTCPFVVAAQTGLKVLQTPYSKEMSIPGDGDFEEAKEIYQYADHAITVWLPRIDRPVGTRVESGNWNFEVTPNLFFVRSLKARYCDPVEWTGIGKVFPMHIQDDGSFLYDPEFHKKIYMRSVA